MTWRSVIHMSFEEFGLHGIANVKVLTGTPDPMPLIYAFFSAEKKAYMRGIGSGVPVNTFTLAIPCNPNSSKDI